MDLLETTLPAPTTKFCTAPAFEPGNATPIAYRWGTQSRARMGGQRQTAWQREGGRRAHLGLVGRQHAGRAVDDGRRTDCQVDALVERDLVAADLHHCGKFVPAHARTVARCPVYDCALLVRTARGSISIVLCAL